ncbi:MAG TPA: hypothetical protein VJ823_06065 [Rhodanobacteraceae bacterium]|nr:hypothetical protein [Rhodanobacteraceae bacterium]
MAVPAAFENAERNGIACAWRTPDNARSIADFSGVRALAFIRITDLDLAGKRVLIREGEAELS